MSCRFSLCAQQRVVLNKCHNNFILCNNNDTTRYIYPWRKFRTMKRQICFNTKTKMLTSQTRIGMAEAVGCSVSSLYVGRAGNTSVAFRKWRIVTARASGGDTYIQNIIINFGARVEGGWGREGGTRSSNKTLLSFRATKPDWRWRNRLA